jgi:Xaa-Pro aminopeptidase
VYNQRIARLRESLEEPLLVTFLPNVRYLTGFTGSNAFVFVSQDRFIFSTDGRYAELAGRLVADIDGGELVVYRSGLEDVITEQFAGYDRVGLEAQDVKWSFVHGLKAKTQSVLTPTKGKVEALRQVKDQTEIAALMAAAGAGDRAFGAVRKHAQTAVTEGDLSWALIEEMRRAGGTQAGWPPIVACDANAALPHHLSANDPVGSGLLLLDYGCTVDGYHSDMSRTIWLEGEIEVDEICRVALRKYGYEDLFVHSTGHGVGLEIHEGPRLAPKSDDVLTAGNVVTVEPGVYVPGFGGIRIEDMVLVTDDGHRVLTESDKGLEA